MSVNYALKRRAIEAGHSRSRAKQQRSGGGFYFGGSRALYTLLRAGLEYTGLRRVGERNALRPVVRRVGFAFDDLPRAFDGFRILHLSDLHVDGLDGLAESIAERVAGLDVDLCVMTGDYRFDSTGPCEQVYPHMETILSAVRSRHGVVGILGNHDYAEEARALRELGVTMLVNEAVEVREGGESMWLLGLDDPHYYGCDDLPGTLARVPEDAFKVLLVHSPELVGEAARGGVRLYLCGHTHGGQICAPGFGPVIVNADCERRFARGAWREGGLQGYTSSGLGCSVMPVRFFCPPEVALIELESKAVPAVRKDPERVAA